MHNPATKVFTVNQKAKKMTGRYWFYLALLGNAEAGRTRDPNKVRAAWKV